MSNNVIEQAIRPEVPDVIPNEFFYVYVPKATTTNPGIASFDADDFNVANGVVTIDTTKWGDKDYIAGKLLASANRIVRGSTNYAVAVDTTLKTINITSTDNETLEDGTVRSIPTTYNIPFKAGRGTTFVLDDDIIAIKSDVGVLGTGTGAEIFNNYGGVNRNQAGGNYSHAEGYGTIAGGDGSHAEGYVSEAEGDYSHAEGRSTVAGGDYSHAEGYGTIAIGRSQHVFGQFNVQDSSKVEIVGWGTLADKKNIRTLSFSGNQWIAGKYSQEGTPTANKDLTTKLYVDTVASSLNDDIMALKAIVGTGENYVGQLSGSSLPSTSLLNNYVQEQESRAPQGGDTIMFVLYVTGGEDEIYKYMYNGTTWTSFMIPAVEVSSNGELGVVKGTCDIGSDNDIIVDIVNGEIKNIYAKDKNSEYFSIGLPASLTEIVTSVAAGTTGYDITCEVNEARVDNTNFSYDQVRNLPIVGGTGVSLSVEDNLVKIDTEVTKNYVDTQDNAVKTYVDGKDTTINNRIVDSNIRINNLERSVYGELADWSDETFLSLKNAILPSTIIVDSSTYNVVDEANAILSSLKGNTKQFNQLVPSLVDTTTINGVTFTNNGDGSMTLNGTASADIGSSSVGFKITGYFWIPRRNHKCIVALNNTKAGLYYGITGYNISYFNERIVFKQSASTDWHGDIRVYITSGTSFTNFVIYPQLFDLTQMNEEDLTTTTFAEKYQKSYYPYNAGTLYDSVISGVSLTGKNLWDEEWEVGGIDNQTGENASSTRIRCKNYIPVIGGMLCYCFQKNNYEVNLFAYDEDKNFIGVYANGNFVIGSYSSTGVQNSSISLPPNCAFIKFKIDASYGTTYNNDICINVSDASFNGTYEPYHLSTISLPSTQTLGGVGTAQDEIQVTKNENDDYYTIKKILRVKADTLNGTSIYIIDRLATTVSGKYRFLTNNVNASAVLSAQLPSLSGTDIYNAKEGMTVSDTYSGNLVIYLEAMSGMTVQEANTYLSSNPITILIGARIKISETIITTTATLAEVSAIRTNGGMISVQGNTNEDYAQPDVSETILHSVTANA